MGVGALLVCSSNGGVVTCSQIACTRPCLAHPHVSLACSANAKTRSTAEELQRPSDPIASCAANTPPSTHERLRRRCASASMLLDRQCLLGKSLQKHSGFIEMSFRRVWNRRRDHILFFCQPSGNARNPDVRSTSRGCPTVPESACPTGAASPAPPGKPIGFQVKEPDNVWATDGSRAGRPGFPSGTFGS